MARARLVCVLTLVAALVGLPAGPVGAHSGDGLAQPIFEQMSPPAPGVGVQVAYSANYQLLVKNTTSETVTFLADSGEAFLQIGPKGVLANFVSPTFYDSNVPGGLQRFPPLAKPGPEVAPIWRKIAAQPSWGWYDHRLHPAERSVAPEIRKANKVAVLGRWTVPFRLGDRPGELQGRFEYRPPKGRFSMAQKSSSTPAPGVKIQVAPATTVPAVFVENLSPEPVVVLGRDGEPFARIGPKAAEVNVRSPLWAEIQQAKGLDPSDEADSAAGAKWQQVSDTPRWSWIELRGAAPKTDPPDAVIAVGRPVTVREWTVPVLIGDRRADLEAITEFVPLAELQKRAVTNPEPAVGPNVLLYAGAGLVAALLLAGGWVLRTRRPRLAPDPAGGR